MKGAVMPKVRAQQEDFVYLLRFTDLHDKVQLLKWMVPGGWGFDLRGFDSAGLRIERLCRGFDVGASLCFVY